MNILLVGHEGYVGAGLFRTLSARHHIIGWSREQDITAIDETAISRHRIDAVVNCAAVMERSAPTFPVGSASEKVNVLGVRQLVKSLSSAGIPLIQISTKDVFGRVYGPQDVIEQADGYLPRFRVGDTQPFAPQTAYAKTKLIGEYLAESHSRTAIIRLSTCYTDFDHSRGNWLVKMIRASLDGSPVRLTHTGKQFRDMLHVEDLGRLIEAILDRGLYGVKVNAGGGEQNTYSLLQVLKMIGSQSPIEFSGEGDYGFAFDNKGARDLFGWEPAILVRDRIEEIKENIALQRRVPLAQRAMPGQAVLLAAGKGERLGSVTRECPKPLLEIRGKPVILHNIEMCKRAGITRLFVNLHHCPEKIRDFLGDGSQYGVSITYSFEESLLGTAGALANFRRHLIHEPFFVIYADNYSEYDLQAIWEQHSRAQADMSIAVFELEETRNSGAIIMDGSNVITRFVEKPAVPIGSNWVNAGLYIVEPFLLRETGDGVADFGKDVIPRFLLSGRRILGVKMPRKVIAIDTPELFAQQQHAV